MILRLDAAKECRVEQKNLLSFVIPLMIFVIKKRRNFLRSCITFAKREKMLPISLATLISIIHYF